MTAFDWNQGEERLIGLLNEYHKSAVRWNLIMSSNAGKDSGHVAHQLRKEYRLTMLTATWVPLKHTNMGEKTAVEYKLGVCQQNMYS